MPDHPGVDKLQHNILSTRHNLPVVKSFLIPAVSIKKKINILVQAENIIIGCAVPFSEESWQDTSRHYPSSQKLAVFHYIDFDQEEMHTFLLGP
jgi:hypothetical protein